MGNRYRKNGYNGANAPYSRVIDQPAAQHYQDGQVTLFSAPTLTRWQQVKALAAEIYQSRAARLAALILTTAAVALLFLAAQGCASDPVARQIIERQADYWEQDHRPIIPDADYMQLDPGQRDYYLPASTAHARRFAMQKAKEYARE